VFKTAAENVARQQLQEAIESGDTKQIKGALLAARRLDCVNLSEYHSALNMYSSLRKFPENWDVAAMIDGRTEGRFIAKSSIDDPKVLARFQALLDSSHRAVWTRDRGGDGIPDRLQLVNLVEVANGELWVDYMARQEGIRRELQSESHKTETGQRSGVDDFAQTFFEVDADTNLIAVGGAGEEHLFAPPLDHCVNEVLLFHGTSPLAAETISRQNFRVDFAGSNAGTLYGRGVYFAENASKSDEYTRPHIRTGNRTLLLCRVTLGKPYYTDQVDVNPRDCEHACLKQSFHSILGDRRKCRGTFREFVVFDEDQVYANYILTYRRVMKASKPGTE